MEGLYAKLYNKYTKLKKDKESQSDKLNRDQELKFLNYAAAADEMIEYLKSENDKLCRQVDELKSEVDSIRSYNDEQHIQQQKLLTEEYQKNKELSEDNSKLRQLRQLRQVECSNQSMNEEIRNEQQNSHKDSPAEGMPVKSANKSVKKRKLNHTNECTAAPHVAGELELPTDQHVYGNKGNGAPLNILQPACCHRKISSSGLSGGDVTDTRSVNCLFQCLVEFVVGMKVSPLIQSNEPCILALHQSSGYSFSLTWLTNSHGEAELLYRVLSLGTFEKVAPEWMRQMLIFSSSMCSIFFERISRVIKC